MNILIDPVPSKLNIGGTDYALNTDFRIWIMFEQLLTDSKLSDDDKNRAAFQLVFCDKPPFCNEAVNKIIWFYSCGKEYQDEKGLSGNYSHYERIYDYDFDDDYIYAAFLQQYNIDLQTIKNLHWWQFKAMLKGLTDNCKFVEIMGYRAVEIKGDMPKAQKEFYRKMKKIYALPIPADEIEKTNIIEEALLRGESVNNLL